MASLLALGACERRDPAPAATPPAIDSVAPAGSAPAPSIYSVVPERARL